MGGGTKPYQHINVKVSLNSLRIPYIHTNMHDMDISKTGELTSGTTKRDILA